MAKYVLIDSGFWFGLFDRGDGYHDQSNDIDEIIKGHILIIPFPSLYEVLDTSIVKNKLAIVAIEEMVRDKRAELVYDEIYRDKALETVYSIHKNQTPHYSLVDCIMREMIKDINLRIDFMVTYNSKDFKDLCDKRKITMLP